jgi:hypothetical protein
VGGANVPADVTELLSDARRRLESRIASLPDTDPDRAEASAARLTALMTRTTSGALLVEQGAEDGHKALIATRFVRRNFAPETDDSIADHARQLLSYEEIDPSLTRQ